MTKNDMASISKNDGGAAKARLYSPDVPAIIRGLTPVQRGFVRDGSLHGDVTMPTVRALRAKALFYHHIDSPNGRCGPMLLTPLGKTVQAALRAAANPAPSESQ